MLRQKGDLDRPKYRELAGVGLRAAQGRRVAGRAARGPAGVLAAMKARLYPCCLTEKASLPAIILNPSDLWVSLFRVCLF